MSSTFQGHSVALVSTRTQAVIYKKKYIYSTFCPLGNRLEIGETPEIKQNKINIIIKYYIHVILL